MKHENGGSTKSTLQWIPHVTAAGDELTCYTVLDSNVCSCMIPSVETSYCYLNCEYTFRGQSMLHSSAAASFYSYLRRLTYTLVITVLLKMALYFLNSA